MGNLYFFTDTQTQYKSTHYRNTQHEQQKYTETQETQITNNLDASFFSRQEKSFLSHQMVCTV